MGWCNSHCKHNKALAAINGKELKGRAIAADLSVDKESYKKTLPAPSEDDDFSAKKGGDSSDDYDSSDDSGSDSDDSSDNDSDDHKVKPNKKGNAKKQDSDSDNDSDDESDSDDSDNDQVKKMSTKLKRKR